jgi:hypothetical protein
MNTIVYVAIALLVLVLLVAFTTGGLGKLFDQVFKTGVDDIDAAQSQCSSACSSAELRVSTQGTNVWENSQYCRKEFSIDVEGRGDAEILRCWQDPISVNCKTSKGTVHVTEQNCKSYPETLIGP